jgi:hypothetical protein
MIGRTSGLPSGDAAVDAVEALIRDRGDRAGTGAAVAIDGRGGSGKSTLAARISARGGAFIVHTDDFASWENPVDWWPRLVEQVLRPLAGGEIPR